MDENLARLNKIYPNGQYVLIPSYNPELWKDREYDSSLDNKAALNKPLTESGNEVAFYRRVRSHDKRSAEKKDGRIKWDFSA